MASTHADLSRRIFTAQRNRTSPRVLLLHISGELGNVNARFDMYYVDDTGGVQCLIDRSFIYESGSEREWGFMTRLQFVRLGGVYEMAYARDGEGGNWLGVMYRGLRARAWEFPGVRDLGVGAAAAAAGGGGGTE
jgi:hypothetical protein